MTILMVAIDRSNASNDAFDTVCKQMKEGDTLYILTVVVRIVTYSDLYATPSYESVTPVMNEMKKSARKLLLAYGEKAKHRGIHNFNLLLTIGNHAGESIIDAAKTKHVDMLYVGSRGLGLIGRILLGSVSKHVLEHAPCNVVVVKSRIQPSEVHEISRKEARNEEEKERNRRIQEESHDVEFHSALDKNIVILAEEEERWRRIHEEEDLIKKEEKDREKTKQTAIEAEEEERKRRISEDIGHKTLLFEFLRAREQQTHH